MATNSTAQQIKITDEDKKKILDKEYRMQYFYKITNKDAKLVIFKRNRAQEHFYRNRANRNIILKSRQLGFTTYSVVDMLDETLFNPNYHTVLISYDKDSALEIFDNKIMLAWEHFPLKTLYGVDTERANKLKVSFGASGMYSDITVKSSGRSSTNNRVHISEFAKICAKYPKMADEIITGTIPSVPINGKLDIESTAEGETGAFYDMFWEAWNRPTNVRKRHTELKAHFYNWQWDDDEINKIKKPDAQIPKEFRDYQSKHNILALRYPDKYQPITDIQLTWWFYKWLSINRNWNKLFQEYPTTPEEAFRSSGAKLFDLNKIDELKREAEDFQKNHPPQENNGWLYYQDYIPGHIYAMGVDPSEGTGRDSSAISIIDFTPIRPKIVATFKNDKTAPDILAYEIRTAGIKYGYPLVAVELNNHGHATLTQLKQIYPVDMIYKIVKMDKEVDERTEKLGWHSNLATKPKMMYDLVTATNDKAIEIPSLDILHEMRIYDRSELSVVRADPEASNHFDLLIATGIAFQMKSELDVGPQASSYVPKQTSNDIYSAI